MPDAVLEYAFVADDRSAARIALGAIPLLAGPSLVLAPIALGLSALLLPLDLTLAALVGLIGVTAAIVIVIVYLQTRKAMRAGHPPASVSTARYDAVIRVADERREQQLPYPFFVGVRASRTVVVLRPRFGQPLVLPAELCPPAARARVASGIAAGWTPVPDLSGFTHVSHIDPDAARRIVRRGLATQLTYPSGIFTLALVVVLALAAQAIGGPLLALPTALGMLVLIGALVLVVRAHALRELTGETVRTRFDDAGFTLYERGVITRRPYSDVERLRVAGGLLVARFRDSAASEVFPAELFPPEAIARFAAAGARLIS